MPNEISNDLHKVEHAIEDWTKNTLEPALDKEWALIKPEVIALGETALSIIWQAASTYVLTGGNNFAAALAAAKTALAAAAHGLETQAEHIIATALSGAIANLLAKAPGQ